MKACEILVGDSAELLASVAPGSVRCVVTSPPYWGLRDYGVEGQLGLEADLAAYLSKLVAIFRLVRQALADDGTCWINLGDCYSTQPPGKRGPAIASSKLTNPTRQLRVATTERGNFGHLQRKQLVGLPWRVAFALQEDGWFLRSDIVWSKPNPMPESVADRPTKSHEYLFLLSKAPRYFYNGDAVREPVSGGAHPRGSGINPKARGDRPSGWASEGSKREKVGRYGMAAELQDKREGRDRRRVDLNSPRVPGKVKANESFSAAVRNLVETRNRRTVWTIPTEPFRGAHFATFPKALVRPCVLAGSEPGDLVLDPFAGAGTTGVVALQNARRFLGFELKPEYAEIARQRCAGVQMHLQLNGRVQS